MSHPNPCKPGSLPPQQCLCLALFSSMSGSFNWMNLQLEAYIHTCIHNPQTRQTVCPNSPSGNLRWLNLATVSMARSTALSSMWARLCSRWADRGKWESLGLGTCRTDMLVEWGGVMWLVCTGRACEFQQAVCAGNNHITCARTLQCQIYHVCQLHTAGVSRHLGCVLVVLQPPC